MKVEVHLLGGTRKIIDIDPSATRGATMGVNVWNQDGTLFVPPTGGGGTGVSVTAWELILDIPPNVSALAAQAGTGIYVLTGAGTSATRSITSTDGSVAITNPAGLAGNIDLSVPMPNLESNRITADGNFRVTTTSALRVTTP